MYRTLSGASKDRRLAARWAPKGAVKIASKLDHSVVYCYQTTRADGKTVYGALAYWGTSGKPTWHISFRTEDQRREAVTEFFQNISSHLERKGKQRADKAAWINPLKVGDLLYTSWGYDQTNVEFYAVTRVSGKRVWIREIAGDSESTGYMQEKCWPKLPITFVGEETMHLAQPGDPVSVKIDHHYAWLEQGRTHHSSSYA
jgi:hypothetical protein